MSAAEPAAPESPAVEDALATIRLLSEEIGPRRPTGAAERAAAGAMVALLTERGIDARTEAASAYSTFLLPYGVILGLGVLAGTLPRRHRGLRGLLASAGLAGAISEGGLVRTPLSRVLARRETRNVVAPVEPTGAPKRTLCLVCHLDSSRSGLMFHPPVVAWLRHWVTIQTAALAVTAAEPVLRSRRLGRGAVRAARALVAAGLALLLERELRGADVPGANDNASGVAVVAQLAAETASAPLASTRLVILMTSAEEAGLLGAQSFLRRHDTTGWLFLNFDGVGAPATLRFLRREGVVTTWPSDPALISIAERIAADRPELELAPSERGAGLTYDVSPVLARGGRALTFSVHDRTIPHYHQPSDDMGNIERRCLARALEVGREMLRAIDGGEAD